jgi:hypothetical protein
MCYILCMIVGPPIRGFRGAPPKKIGGGLFTKFLGGLSPLAGVVFFSFGSLVVHGISAHGFLILVKELRL